MVHSLGFKVLLSAMALAIGAYSLVCAFLLLCQNRFIFFPFRTIAATPDDFNLPYEEVWLPVTPLAQNSAVEQLHGWWLPATEAGQNVALHLHGNGSNIGANLFQALQLHRAGFAVLMIDYRGYGRSKGRFPTEASVYQDANIAWDYLVQERGITPKQLVLFGHSLGGAIAIDLALNHPETAGLIVQSSFTSMHAMVKPSWSWMLPINLLLTQRFDSITKVRSLKMPVLYIHGTADAIIPVSMSKTLFAASPEPKQLLLVEGAAHNNVAEVGDTVYLQKLKQFGEQINRNRQQANYEQQPSA